MKHRYFHLLAFAACLLGAAGCDLSEKSYSETTPDSFFTAPENTYAVLSRPFAHWYYYVTPGRPNYRVLENSTDEMCCPKRGSDFDNGGHERELWYHSWTPEQTYIESHYNLTLQGVAYALSAYDDLAALDYTQVGLTAEDQRRQLAQLDALIGYFYLMGLDAFGGLPIYTSSKDGVKPRSTERELFNHVEERLLNAVEDLPAKAGSFEKQDGYMRKASAALLLARLYFNAEAFLVDRNDPAQPADLGGVDYYAKAERICRDLIDGVYGPYELDTRWNGVKGFDNDASPEAIWNVPAKTNLLEMDYWFRYNMPYNIDSYFNVERHTAYNGFMLAPSLDPTGKPYPYRLGNTYAHFNDADLRKKPYRYRGNKQYEGQFLVGTLVNPDTGGACVGNREYAGQTLTLVDQVARFSELGKNYARPEDLPSTMYDGEENSGVRLVLWPVPDQSDVDIRWDPDFVYLRLTEAYYTLAECLMRRGEKEEAAELINQVRKRYFTGGNDPDPVTAANLDMYRMLQEWQIEFLGEGRRRTDLVRWGQYTEGEWWDHAPTHQAYRNRFPIPSTAIVAAQGVLDQTPGYVQSE